MYIYICQMLMEVPLWFQHAAFMCIPLQEPFWNAAVKIFAEGPEPEDLKDTGHYQKMLEPRVKSFLKMVLNSS